VFQEGILREKTLHSAKPLLHGLGAVVSVGHWELVLQVCGRDKFFVDGNYKINEAVNNNKFILETFTSKYSGCSSIVSPQLPIGYQEL
jgi:hypothetical protein